MDDKPVKKLPGHEIFYNKLYNLFDLPVIWFREKFVAPNRPEYPYYHRKFRRVPTVDECDYRNLLCQFEADEQLKRDHLVDSKVLNILRKRKQTCFLVEYPDYKEKCAEVAQNYEDAAENWFIKYGDMGFRYKSRVCYMKQKHRMVWERRQAEKVAKENDSITE